MDFNFSNTSKDVNTLLYSAQIIADSFAKTMEDNNCLLMLSIGLHQEINNTIKDLEDVTNNTSDTNDILDKTTSENVPGTDLLNTINDIVDDLKDKCFNCNLALPGIDFNIDLKEILSSLQMQLNLYKNLFKTNKIDLCQPAYAMQTSCVPDILRLITLLLTAFVSIMTLRKLSNISITAFIKGVLSTLLSKITQSLKITINIGSTNISCLINTLQEIALAIPTQKNIENRLAHNEQLALGLIDANGESTNSNKLKVEAFDKLNKNLDSSSQQLDKFDTEIRNGEKQINEAFTLVNAVVDLAIDDINNYIESLLSFQTYFECETKRSGMDLEEAIGVINNLIQVINMLSSLVLSMVKKELRESACKTNSTINNLSDTEIDDLQIKDIIEDMNQKVVEVIESTDNALEVIIHETPTKSALPKLDLLDCSIDDFIEAHTLPRIIELAKKQLEEEQRTFTSKPEFTYTFEKPSKEQKQIVENIVDLIYTKPEKEVVKEKETVIVDIKNPIGIKGLSSLLSETIRNDKKQKDLACKSVEDVLSILNNIKK